MPFSFEHVSRSYRPRTEVFAVLRYDHGVADVEQAITVKGILWSRDEAEREVARLNKVNAANGCRYFLQPTRLFPSPEGTT